MSRFYGPIGFVSTKEEPEGSGIWNEIPVEKNYRGDISKNSRRWDNGEHLNKNLNINNTISIVADPYISNHLMELRYVKWLGGYWEITNVDVQSPRLVLSIGGVYNGPTVGITANTGEHPRVK